MGGGRVQLHAVRVGIAQHITGKLHDGKLHAEAETEIRNVMSPCVGDGMDLSVNSSVAEAARNQNAVHI